ncbi:hypothetical protein VB715_14095 [Crocosphaera sp. UHCC 0190]|uniref:hypothetical protein n=1 Tax=Crocosphaera sp. UHCC 0190 TaxID=3110246 RepID=UPI002B220775|nr:hypothetical protein [Crocosphaera sp. UHCC 0190]MEA5510901.1 hypothetical protein [Crocosphaera sp. UHCC 0190]
MDKKFFIFFSVFGALLATIIIIISQKSQQHLINSRQISYNTFEINTDKQPEVIAVKNRYRVGSYSYQTQKNRNSFSQSYQQQQTQINLSQSELDSPYFLTISTGEKNTQLTAEIYLNGNLIQRFNHSQNIIDLSPYLTPGRQVILISGNYTPNNDSVMLELKGKNTQIRQETAGSGQLQQHLIIDVQ